MRHVTLGTPASKTICNGRWAMQIIWNIFYKKTIDISMLSSGSVQTAWTRFVQRESVVVGQTHLFVTDNQLFLHRPVFTDNDIAKCRL